jgi:hypothetical protein
LPGKLSITASLWLSGSDSDLVKSILALHAAADDVDLARKTEKIVEEYLARGK